MQERKAADVAQNWLAKCGTNAGNIGPILSDGWLDISVERVPYRRHVMHCDVKIISSWRGFD